VKGGRYDIVTVGPFEVQAGWAKNGWLEPLNASFDKLSEQDRANYALNDLISTIKDALTVNNTLFALPFYGESSFTMYRKDLFEAKGLKMPDEPTWDDIRKFALALKDPAHGIYGIAMKGVPDYGQLAPFITFMHSYGAKWFDEAWKPQITSPEFKRAFEAYVNLLKEAGEPGATSVGFNEALTLMSQGRRQFG
jgi:sorbitol/mannitol transport system substrate-binding protein